MKKRKSLITILAFVLIIITTFSYSALSTRFQIVSDVVFRVDADIRVNDISLDSTSNGGLISFDSNYTKNTITSGFKLPNLNSSISYNVTITNKGNIDQAIYDLTTFSTSNDNIYYLIDDMPLNEALPMIVPFGTSKTIKITYKTTSPFTQTETIVNSFVFKKVYYVDYNLKGGSYTNDQNDLKNGQIKYEDVDLTLTNEKPIKNKYAFIGWTDEQNGTTVKYPSGSTYSLNKNIILYAVYRQGEATFIQGPLFNLKIKSLTGAEIPDGDAGLSMNVNTITSIVRANSLPQGFTPTDANIVSTNASDFPIYAWFDNGTIYYYTIVDNPYMNAYANNMFRSLSGATSIDISTINTSRTKSMHAMFMSCNSLSSLDLSNFDTSLVGTSAYASTGMTYMFYGCSSLTTLNLSTFNTSNVTSMAYMFFGCTNLQSVTFGNNFDTSNVAYMSYMFSNCYAINNINLNNFNTSKVINMERMFRNCRSLTSMNLSNFNLSSVTNITDILSGMTLLRQLKTPNTNPSDTSVTIDLPTTLYDSNGVAYTSLNSSSPTSTWLKVAYTVSFDSNGGTGTMNDQKVQYNTSTNLNTNTFTRTNYTFAGWNTRADGTGTAYLDGASVNALASANETITLYAQWVGFTYTVTADANGGSIPSTSGWSGTGSTSTKTVNFGSTYGTLPTPTREGYTFKGWKTQLLPNEYQGVEYIESTGTQYINTRFIPNQDTRIVADYQYTKNDHGYRFTGAEHLNSNNKEFRFGTGKVGNNIYYLLAYNSSDLVVAGTPDLDRHFLDFDKNVVKLDDSILYTFRYHDFTAYGNNYIFSINSNEIEDLAHAKLYSYKLYDNDLLIRDFIPCYRKSDNVAGLYDVVTNEFYTNAGSGTFTVGNSTNGEYVYNSTLVTKTENHTLTAIWEPNNYEIVFDKNDTNATGTMGNQSMTYDVSSNLTANAFTKPGGYKFVGWNTKADGTGTAYLNGASVSNLTNVNNGTVTLYAQWEKLMAEDIGHTIQDLNCEDVQCVIDELYYMLY